MEILIKNDIKNWCNFEGVKRWNKSNEKERKSKERRMRNFLFKIVINIYNYNL